MFWLVFNEENLIDFDSMMRRLVWIVGSRGDNENIVMLLVTNNVYVT